LTKVNEEENIEHFNSILKKFASFRIFDSKFDYLFLLANYSTLPPFEKGNKQRPNHNHLNKPRYSA